MKHFANILKSSSEGRAAMKNIYKTVFFVVLMIFFSAAVYSQAVSAATDTVKSVRKNTDTEQAAQNQNQNQNQNRNQGTAKDQGNSQNAGAKSVKKVNSAKPDWSKAKGARPNIVRPSGSGIPKGAGKPGGAGGFKGGR